MGNMDFKEANNFVKALFLGLLILFTSKAYSQYEYIAAGANHSMFLCADNNIPFACGLNGWGQLANLTTADGLVPGPTLNLENVIEMEGGDNHSLFLRSDGTVWGCGFNAQGQLGNGTTTTTYENPPVQVNLQETVIAISAGFRHSLFLFEDSTVAACGDNYWGQLGDSSTINTNTQPPVKVWHLTGVKSMAAGVNHSLFVKNDGTVWGCGINIDGQLGDSTFFSHDTIVQSKIIDVKAVSGGISHSLFLKNDGTVWATGYNAKGQLGTGDNLTRNFPVQISSITEVIAIAAGDEHSYFLKNDGTVWACGENFNGQLGNGTNTDSNIPVQVNSLTEINTITSGSNHGLFLKNNGTVWACGNNISGELGDGTITARNSPVEVTNVCNPTANGKELEENAMFIYPNPGNGIFYLKMNEFNKGVVEIYNSTGQKVYSDPIDSDLVKIDLSKNAVGIYFYQLKDRGRISESGRLVLE